MLLTLIIPLSVSNIVNFYTLYLTRAKYFRFTNTVNFEYSFWTPLCTVNTKLLLLGITFWNIPAHNDDFVTTESLCLVLYSKLKPKSGMQIQSSSFLIYFLAYMKVHWIIQRNIHFEVSNDIRLLYVRVLSGKFILFRSNLQAFSFFLF